MIRGLTFSKAFSKSAFMTSCALMFLPEYKKTQSVESSLPADQADFRPGIADEPLRKVFDLELLDDWHLLVQNVDFQDPDDPVEVWRRHVDQVVEASGPRQGLVEDVGPVGGGNHDDVFEQLDAVHFREELDQHSVGNVGVFGPSGSNRVDFVEENDAGRAKLCLPLIKGT